MSLGYLLLFAALVAIIVGGLWVDYQCNWKKQEFRGFDVLPARPTDPDPTNAEASARKPEDAGGPPRA